MTNNKIEQEFFYPQPPEAVWAYLTKPELMEQWLMKNDFKPELGHDFHFWAGPMPQFDLDGTFYCKVLEIVPHKKLCYSWKGGPGGGQINLDSIVTWTLEDKDGGTRLLLEHTGFKEANFNVFAAMNEGWHRNIRKISERLNQQQHDRTQA